MFFPLPQTDLAYGLSDRYAKNCVVVEDSDADLDFRNLPFEVSCHQGLAKQFHTIHLRFDAASAVISAPASPQGAPQIPLRIDRIVACNCSVARRFPWLCILAWRDHHMGISRRNLLVAFTDAIRPVCGDTADVLIGGITVLKTLVFGESTLFSAATNPVREPLSC